MDKFIKRVYQIFQDNNQQFVDLGLEPVRTLDKYRGQTTNPEAFEFFETPAIFIATSIDWRKEGKIYRGTADIDFHIVQEAPWATGNIYTGFEEALKKSYYHLMCHAILDDLESESTGKLLRINDRDIDTGVVAYNVLKYQCEYYGANFGVGDTVEVADAILQITGKKLVKNF